LLEFRLVRDAEDFQRAWDCGLKNTALINFTVLQPEADVDLPGLIYWDTRKCFVTNIDFEEPIKGLTFRKTLEDKYPSVVIKEESPPPGDLSWEVPLSISFTLGAGGYELGLVVRGNWWERVCATGEVAELAKTQADTNPLTGDTRLVIATLPLKEDVFDMYYHEFEFDEERRRKQEELRDRKLAEYGWKLLKRDPYAEIRDPWQRLEHKYVTVNHRSI
jgi:hypothetical protein